MIGSKPYSRRPRIDKMKATGICDYCGYLNTSDKHKIDCNQYRAKLFLKQLRSKGKEC